MALSPKALQKKREKKQKKRKMKLSAQSSATIMSHNTWPIYECWVPVELWVIGLGEIIISRKNSQGDIAVGMFLLDVFCLGVKNCFVRVMPQHEYRELLGNVEETSGELQLVEASYANTLIHKSVAYAKAHGFKPHKDFSKSQIFLKNLPIDATQQFTFGKDGKPFYTQGPYESEGEARRILRILGEQKAERFVTTLDLEALGEEQLTELLYTLENFDAIKGNRVLLQQMLSELRLENTDTEDMEEWLELEQE